MGRYRNGHRERPVKWQTYIAYTRDHELQIREDPTTGQRARVVNSGGETVVSGDPERCRQWLASRSLVPLEGRDG